MKQLLTILICLTGAITVARAQEDKPVQFSGIIYNVDTNAVVPYVTITNKSKNKAYSASFQGYFSFVAQERDTIVFSAVGYHREAIVIPTNLSERKYTIVLKMRMEAINLPAVRVFPWASIDEFNREFMTMKVADDDLEIAKKNVERASILALARELPRDGKEMQTLNFRNNHIDLSTRQMNQRGANPLLDPLKWGAFIQQILRGDKSRQSPD